MVKRHIKLLCVAKNDAQSGGFRYPIKVKWRGQEQIP